MTRYPRRLVERIVLPDGSRLLLRPLRQQDWRGLQQGFASLTEEDRRLRFFAPLPRLTDEAAKRLCRLDYEREMALALFALDGRPYRGVGVARLVASPEASQAEIAVVVLAAWRGRGLGRLMLERLLGWAVGRGLGTVFALLLEENLVAQRLFRGLGFTLAPLSEEPGVLSARLDLARYAATVASRSKA